MNSSPSLDSLTRAPVDRSAGRRAPAWIIPAAIVLGFALLFLALFRDRLYPAPRVNVAVVMATAFDSKDPTPTNAKSSTGEMLFQASGWIEPDPLPIKATSLMDGVIEKVHVLEGQLVKKGDALATLIADDAKLSHSMAEQNHRTLLAVAEAHLATIETAKAKLKGAEAMLAVAMSQREESADLLDRFKSLPKGAVPDQEIAAARFKVAMDDSRLLVANATIAEATAEVTRLELEHTVKKNEIQAAAIEVEKTQLALSRTVITSPIDGRVLRLLAAPGQKKMLQDNDMDSATIAILYHPSELQVRVDVPLADAAGLQIGQVAKIRCGLLPDQVFEGVVTRITGEADLQRNTLQAKVHITDPVEKLRPEMLCRVEFFGSAGTPLSSSGALALWLPEAALSDGAAWVCDPETKRVSRRALTVTTEKRDGFVRVSEGLRPGEWVILSPVNLHEGQRVNPNRIEP